MSPINLLLNLLKVFSDARSAPFVAVTNEPTTLNKELASFASHGVKGLEDFLYVGHGGDFVRCEHGCEDSAAFDTETRAGAVVRGCRVCCVADDADAALGEAGDWMVA